MPALQVRDFPDDLYDELREYATRNHRSIAQQTIACVEDELRRSKGLEENAGAGAGAEAHGRVIGIMPESVPDAWQHARSVDPWSWLDAFGVEPEEVREVRLAKRGQWKRDIAELHKHWKGPLPTGEEVAQLICEERDARSSSMLADVEHYIVRGEARA